LISMGLRSKAF